MKKLNVLLGIIGVALLMTSCLNKGETSYSGVPLSYITSSETGVKYAQTFDGLPITSPQILLKDEGSFVYIAYTWKESLNTVTPENIYNATVTDISDPIEKSTILPLAAPENETEVPLETFSPVVYGGEFFGYHWIYSYGYEKGDGSKKELRFYVDPTQESENEVIIDVRLEDGAGSITKDQDNVMGAVDIEYIHQKYSAGLSSGNSKSIQVYFRYYLEKSDGTLQLYKSQASNMVIVKS